MNNSAITIVGNSTREPELRYTASGLATINFSVAVNRKIPNRNGDVSEAVSFFNVAAYGSLAEHIAQSVVKGTRVIITGRLDQRTWETGTGDRRMIYELVADEVGVALRWACAKVEKPQRVIPADAMREAVESAPLIPASPEVVAHEEQFSEAF